jgi:hypothetical protein
MERLQNCPPSDDSKIAHRRDSVKSAPEQITQQIAQQITALERQTALVQQSRQNSETSIRKRRRGNGASGKMLRNQLQLL